MNVTEETTTTLTIADSDLEAFVNPLIAAQIAAIPPEPPTDLSDYLTKEQTEALIPVVPPAPDLSQYVTETQLSAALAPYVTAAQATAIAQAAIAAIPTTVSTNVAGYSNAIWLDQYSGTDDQKLTTALAAVAAWTDPDNKPAILLANRKHSLALNYQIHSGVKIVNPFGFGNQLRGAKSTPCSIHFTGTGVLFTAADAQTFDTEFRGYALVGNSKSTAFATGSNVWWTSLWRDLGYTEWQSIWGNSTSKFLNDAILINGWQNINNLYGIAFNFGGSDSNLFVDGCLIDTPEAYTSTDPGHYQGIFNGQQKTTVGPIYMTADNCKGILVQDGNTSDGPLWFNNIRIEGRNASTPSIGPLLEIQGGIVMVAKSWFGFSAGDFVLQSGGDLTLDNPTFGLATNGPKQVIRQTAGVAHVTNPHTNWGSAPTYSGASITVS